MDKELHRIALTAIIHKDGKYLITKRSLKKKAFPGMWTVPGGGLEIDDYVNEPKTTSEHWYGALENALRREIKEEVGLEVGEFTYLLDITYLRGDVPVVILSYYCPYKSGEVTLDEDSIDFAWVTYDEAKSYDLVEGLIDEVKLVEQRINHA